ncbi:MAG: imelysin family protein [Salibacteraceae bacterium]
MKSNFQLTLILSLSFLLLNGCKKDNDDSDSPGFNQGELLVNWGNNIILPSYIEYAKAIGEFDALCQSISVNPSAQNLDLLKEAHNKAYLTWQAVSLFEFGPAESTLLRVNSNIYPCDTLGLNDKVLANEFDLSSASDLSKKGFPAIDYLLYSSQELSSQGRVDYLKTVSSELKTNADVVLDSWSATGANYVSEFKETTGNDVGSSMGMVLNALTQHLEGFHREGKIGIPNGERSFSGTPLPEKVEGVFEAGHSVAYAIENLKSIERIYLGTDLQGNDGIGLEENLNTIEAKYNGGSLDAEIKSQFAKTFEAYSKISTPLKDAVVNQSQQVSDVYKELQKLVVLFKADIPSSLGVLITYQDNDGD